MTKASKAKSKETKQSLFATQTDDSFFYFVERRGEVVAELGKQSTAPLSNENWLPIPTAMEQKPAPREGYLLSSSCSTQWAT